jgi:two-component system, NtrC family, sensor kinase
MENADEKSMILCVDDERNVLRSIQRLFIDEPVEILTAESGAEGLEILEKTGQVKIVISDYRMPEMNGVDFLRIVYKKWPDTIRLVLSGYADTASVVSAINEGHIYKFIPKPWNDDELKFAIFHALERHTLQKRNQELACELKNANENLQVTNQNLEALVEDRTHELTFQNKALEIAQNILDTLPVAVIGLDDNGLVVQCNKMAAGLFEGGGLSVLGCNRKACFPEALNEAVGCARDKGSVAGTARIGQKEVSFMGNVRKFNGGQEVIIFVLMPAGGPHG